MAGEGGFLSRWSRRKRAEAVQEAVPGYDGVVAADEGAAAEIPVGEAGTPVPIEPVPEFDVSTLPTLDEMTGETDISVFLQNGVPEALKHAALRKAWVLDPLIRDHVEPIECGWDFNDPNSMTGFGPLDANVDPAAMLRQIMGEKTPEELAAALDEAPVLPDEAYNVVGEGEAADQTQVTTTDSDAMAPPWMGDAQSGGPSADESHAAPHSDTIDFIDENRGVSRRKRHGGAVPG